MTDSSQRGLAATSISLPRIAERRDTIDVAVVGAHLTGMPLNRELHELGGHLVTETATAPDYRLYALDGTVPANPGLLRVAEGSGARIVVEVWELSFEAFGRFVAAISAPLSIGTLLLVDGSQVKGFLVEAVATDNARDISNYGGWRAYVARAG